MSIECGIITVVKPANITAIDMTIDPTDCDEPCDAIVTITWQNIGGRPITFEPAIIVNDTRTGLGEEITLSRDETTSQTFNLTDLLEDVYTICPDPN